MKFLLFLVIVSTAFAHLKDRSYYEEKFFNWLMNFNIKPPSGWHFVKWLENFATNDDKIETHNAKKLSYTLGHNQFSHMSFEEWRQYIHLGLDRPTNKTKAVGVHRAPSPADLTKLPKTVDWVDQGAVTPAKDQGQCGSCWSFSTTGALEGAFKVKYGNLVSLSEQNLVDCDDLFHGGEDHGCNGGLMDNAFHFIEKNGGICSESDYPYVSGTTMHEGKCSQKKCTKVQGTVPTGFTDVEVNSETALMSAVVKQPVSIAIEADQKDFQLYKAGVYTAECGTNLDHGVLLVGYGVWEDGTKYWKVKNSWSPNWGMDGYILLERAGKQEGGQCGLLMGPPSYPNL